MISVKKQMFECCLCIFNFGRRALSCSKRLLKSAWKVFYVFIMACVPWCKRRDSGESEDTMSHCQCVKKELLEQVLKENENLNVTVSSYKSEVMYLRQRNREIKERSDEITSTMANILENKGHLENVNDEFSNTKLATAFKALYDNKWTNLSEWLDTYNPELNELKRIQNITKLCKKAYEECVRLADDQLRKFLFLDENDKVPSSNDEPALYKTRRRQGQQQNTRNVIKKEVTSKVLELGDTEVFFTEENREAIKKCLEEFFHEFSECCWLMTISHPRLLPKFDVVDLPYSSVKERFRQYSPQEEVHDMEKEKDSVYAVVWPSVELEDGSGFFAKGDVVTVKVGKES